MPSAVVLETGLTASTGSSPDALGALKTWVSNLVDGPFPLEVSAPLFWATAPEAVARIQEFRETQYRERLGYLLGPEQLRLESQLQLDARSAHFAVSRNGRMVGALRMTPAPFEFPALAESLSHWEGRFPASVELSRLVVSPEERSALVPPRLLVAASDWAMKAGFVGIVGLCRRAARTVFERYGLTATSETAHVVPMRGPQPYSLMAGTWPELIAATTRMSERLNRPRKNSLAETPSRHHPMEQT
ncbi:hypothetical protein [Corallococcus llansteffanensis]|nr:hypothetical protein [Corallococcus llansteffanensis]